MLKKGTYSYNFLLLFSGNSFGQLVPLFFAPIVGRLFAAEEMALFASFLALASMLAIIGAGRFEKAFVLPAEKSSAMNLFGLAIRIILIVTLISGSLYFFRTYIYTEEKMAELVYMLVVAVPLYALTSVFTEWLIREKKFRALTLSGLARSAFISLFTILFGYFSFGASGLIWGTLIGLFTALIMMYIAARKSLDFSMVNRSGMLQVAKEYKDFPLINSAHAFADLLFGQFVLYLVIEGNFGLAELGFFTVMSRYLLGSMRAVGGSVGQLYYQDAGERFSKGENVSASFFRSVRLVSIFAVPICIVVLFWGPELFTLYLGENYTRSGEIAQIMIIPLFINFIVSPVSPTPLIYRKQGTAFMLSIAGYVSGIAAFMVGHYYGCDFYDALKLYAIVQSIYYLVLFFWYLKLTRQTK